MNNRPIESSFDKAGQTGGKPGFTIIIKISQDMEYHVPAEQHKDTTTSLHSSLSKNQIKLSMFLQQVISYMIGPGSDVQNIWFGL